MKIVFAFCLLVISYCAYSQDTMNVYTGDTTYTIKLSNNDKTYTDKKFNDLFGGLRTYSFKSPGELLTVNPEGDIYIAINGDTIQAIRKCILDFIDLQNRYYACQAVLNRLNLKLIVEIANDKSFTRLVKEYERIMAEYERKWLKPKLKK